MQLRWPQGFVCPRCGGRRARPSRRGLLRCGQCDYQASVTAGTIFQDTRLPLRTWFRTMWWVTSQKNGASALGLILGHTVPPGRCCTSCGARWCGPAEERSRGGRRDLCGGRRRGTARTQAEKSTGSHRRRGRRRGDRKDPYEAHRSVQDSCTASSKRLSSPTGDGWEGTAWLSARVRLSGRFEPVTASDCCPTHRVAALLNRDAPRRCEPRTPGLPG